MLFISNELPLILAKLLIDPLPLVVGDEANGTFGPVVC